MVPDLYVMQKGFPHPTGAQLHPFQQHCTDGDGSSENQMQALNYREQTVLPRKKASYAI